MSIDVNKSVKDTLKTIVSSYSENKRKLDTEYAAPDKKKILLLAPHLSFLEEMLNKRKATSNLDHRNINSQNEDTEVMNIVDNGVENNLLPNTSSQTTIYKKKNDQLHNSFEKKPKEQQTFETITSQNENIFLKRDECDDIDHFFKSLSLSIKKLPSKGISEAKLKMLSTFMEIEDKYTDYPSTSAE
ncbi:uncharacterized protein LOC113549885 [Rhopalosiphum maidis]|uniref:uncharacterized protein LOC113549885 n=1 Tax=Rhopalosiphum maidis TaxID=43146 RepID=UPI000F00E31E|nr:uncharacterized protein LOC113549885 [Rhopalosiphum maidis]